MHYITFGLLSLLSGAVMASIIVIMIVPEVRAKKATPDRISQCHDQAGTAQLDNRGVLRRMPDSPEGAALMVR